jgi:hypothetical protein
MDLMLRTHLPADEYLKLVSDGKFRHADLDYPDYLLFERTPNVQLFNSESRFFKFSILRHPWNRVVAAYRDKYLDDCKGRRHCFKESYLITISVDETHMSLTEMLKGLIEQAEKHPFKGSHRLKNINNDHFTPSSAQCGVHSLKYDFIGNLDRKEDMDYLMHRINATQPLSNVSHAVVYNKTEVEPVGCTWETVDLARRYYADDLAALNVTMDEAYNACERYGMTHAPSL